MKVGWPQDQLSYQSMVNWMPSTSTSTSKARLCMQCYLLESPVANGQPLLATVVGHEGVAVGVADTPTLLALVSCSKQIRSCDV